MHLILLKALSMDTFPLVRNNSEEAFSESVMAAMITSTSSGGTANHNENKTNDEANQWIQVKGCRKNRHRTVSATAITGDHMDPTSEDPLTSILHIVEYSAKYKKKLKEHNRTDTELADLFSFVGITGGAAGSSNTEHRIATASKKIRKMKNQTFRIRSPPSAKTGSYRQRSSLNDLDDSSTTETDIEDSQTRLSSDTAFKRVRFRIGNVYKPTRLRRFQRYKMKESMDTVLENFGPAMRFSDN